MTPCQRGPTTDVAVAEADCRPSGAPPPRCGKAPRGTGGARRSRRRRGCGARPSSGARGRGSGAPQHRRRALPPAGGALVADRFRAAGSVAWLVPDNAHDQHSRPHPDAGGAQRSTSLAPRIRGAGSRRCTGSRRHRWGCDGRHGRGLSGLSEGTLLLGAAAGCGESPGSCSLGYSLRTGVACCRRHGIQTRSPCDGTRRGEGGGSECQINHEIRPRWLVRGRGQRRNPRGGPKLGTVPVAGGRVQAR